MPLNEIHPSYFMKLSLLVIPLILSFVHGLVPGMKYDVGEESKLTYFKADNGTPRSTRYLFEGRCKMEYFYDQEGENMWYFVSKFN